MNGTNCGLHVDDKVVGLSISQWLPCPLAIWNFSFGMAILLKIYSNLARSVVSGLM